jgi:hypothetical protein
MSPKKKTGKELPVEGSSQAARGRDLTIAQTTIETKQISQIAHPQPSAEPHPTTTESKRHEDLVEQPVT